MGIWKRPRPVSRNREAWLRFSGSIGFFCKFWRHASVLSSRSHFTLCISKERGRLCKEIHKIIPPAVTWLTDKQYNLALHIAQFQITDFSRFGSLRFGMVKVLSIVWLRCLLLCPFHNYLRIWEKKSFVFCQTDNPQFSFIMYCYTYRQLSARIIPSCSPSDQSVKQSRYLYFLI